jgi:O-antigen/teichoic acid export membrane protein
MRRELVQLGRNFLLSLGGEGLQSGFHFILTLVLIRLLSLHDFGIFAIAFVLGGIALTYGNAFVSVPATVRLARLKSRGAIDYLDVVFGSIALIVAIAAAIIAALALWLTTGHAIEALAGGAFAGCWTLRNHVRTAMFARRAMSAAIASDFSYTASGVIFVAAVLWLVPDVSVTAALSALAAANILAILVALRAVNRPRISFGRDVRRRYREILPDVGWSVVGTTTWNVQGQALTFLVAAIAGPAAYAPIAASVALLSPLRPAISAIINVFRPDFALALAGKQYRRVRLTLYALCAIIALGCAAMGLIIWLGWPLIEAYVFAGKFSGAAMPLIVGLTGLSVLIYSIYNAPLAFIQAAGEFKPIALATTFGAIVGLTSISILLAVTSVAWSLIGVVAGEAVCGAYLWIAARRVLRGRSPVQRPTVPVNAATEMSA